MIQQYRDSHLGGKLPIFDGTNTLFTVGQFPFLVKKLPTVFLGEDDGSGAPRRERQFHVIEYASREDLHNLEFVLSGKHEAPQQLLDVLQIVLKESHFARYYPVARSFFTLELEGSQSLGNELVSYRGFHQSIRLTQMGLSLNVDISTRIFIEPLPVIEYVCKFLARDDVSEFSNHEHHKVVLTTH